jgi:arylsulfatase A-like enzyme
MNNSIRIKYSLFSLSFFHNLMLATLFAPLGILAAVNPAANVPDASAGGIPGLPNILLILTDDQGYHDLSCQGATDFATPHIDSIAAMGVRFTDGYVTAPQCAPSRAGLMTGVSQSRFGFVDNSNHRGLPPPEVVQILPEYLKRAGYTTGVIGKWHIGNVRADQHGVASLPEGSERFVMLPGNHPSERGFDYLLLHNAGGSHYFPYRADGMKWMTDRDREHRLQQMLEGENEPYFLDDLPEDTYLTDYFSKQAVSFIRRNQEQPWFLFLSYNAPHTPMVARADKLQKYAHIEDRNRRQLVAMMDSLDEGVGIVLESLLETGQLENTLIWFLSDNGAPTHQNASRNDPLSGRKGDMHEGGIRVPFLAAWPNVIPPGQVLRDPVISLDILSTSLAAAGIEVPPIHDGANLLPWLTGQGEHPNEVLLWTWRSNAAIRLGSLKETRNGNDVRAIDGTVIPRHIFVDLAENPQELPSKALASPEKKSILAQRLDRWLEQVQADQVNLTP